MSVTSFYFFIFFAVTLITYYICPRTVRWLVLLAGSIVFFFFSSEPYTIFYLIANIAVTHVAAVRTEALRKEEKDAKHILTAAFIIDAGILAFLKYSGFVIRNLNAVFSFTSFSIPEFMPASPAAVSFYTLISIGYLLDSYWGICEAQKNPLKTALFICYYPQMTSGPVTRYGMMSETLYEGAALKYGNLTYGMQRMLWGILKKLVISSRAALLVDTVFADAASYKGIYIWLAAALFMIQLYTDFSGCMDIIIGASECYGVILPENFRSPFFSRSVQEYWQRWHMTLGAWLKDYILFPLLRSDAFRKLKKNCRARFGKKAADKIQSYLGMLCVWLLIGLWHGGEWKFIIGMGLWFYACIVINQLLQPVYKKMTERLNINPGAPLCSFLLSVKVFILAMAGNMFFRLPGLNETFRIMGYGFSVFNPGALSDGSVISLLGGIENTLVLVFGIILLFVVSAVQERRGSVRGIIAEKGIVFRWIFWYAVLFFVIVFGMYGPDFSVSDFIYRGF